MRAASRSAASKADIVPVYRQLLADRLTPVTAFEVLGGTPHAFLLESVVGGEKIARYSFIATSPVGSSTRRRRAIGAILRIAARGPRNSRRPIRWPIWRSCCRPSGITTTRICPHSPAAWSGTPVTTRFAITRRRSSTSPPTDDRQLPDLLFGLYGELVIFDHVDKTIKVVANADVQSGQRQGSSRSRRIATPAGGSTTSCERLQQPPTRALGEIDPRGPLTLTFEQQHDAGGVRGGGARRARSTSRPATSSSSCPASGCGSQTDGRPVRRLPRAAGHQPVAVHVLPEEPGVHADRVSRRRSCAAWRTAR